MIKRQKHVTFVGLWSYDETDHWCTCKSGCPSRRCSSCWTDRDWSCRDQARCSPAPRSLSSPERDSQHRQHADPAGKQSYMQAKGWSTMSLNYTNSCSDKFKQSLIWTKTLKHQTELLAFRITNTDMSVVCREDKPVCSRGSRAEFSHQALPNHLRSQSSIWSPAAFHPHPCWPEKEHGSDFMAKSYKSFIYNRS